MKKEIFWCKNCLNMSTRPRIEFNKDGVCNACQWVEEKLTVKWDKRIEELVDIIKKYKVKDSAYDCIIPVSGGKDSSYVSYKLKHEYGLNPLTITVRPGIFFDIGEKNLNNFINSGYDNITIKPNLITLKKIDKLGLVEYGIPMLGWQTIIQAYIPKLAVDMGIPFIFYGEDGEVEYGGSTETKNRAYYTVEYAKSVYLAGTYKRIMESGLSKQDMAMYQFPSEKQLKENNVLCMNWSYFEAWDSYRNYVVAKEKCGLQEKESTESATYNNFAQNDTCLYDLHTYLMYLKFGFGRTTQDAGIDIRRGAMDREQAINLVSLYENRYPEQYIEMYLEYYEMTRDEFDEVIDKWANKDLFEKIDNQWMPKFNVAESFYI